MKYYQMNVVIAMNSVFVKQPFTNSSPIVLWNKSVMLLLDPPTTLRCIRTPKYASTAEISIASASFRKS